MTPELTRPVPLSKIRPQGLIVLVRATHQECRAVASRMDLPAIQSLECSFDLTRAVGGATVAAKGRLRAQVSQICVVSGEEFETMVEDEFEVRFVPEGTERDEPDPDLPDEIPYASDVIDLGEATAEQLGLALDPYPRIEGATVPDSEDDESVSPFSALARRPGPGQTPH